MRVLYQIIIERKESLMATKEQAKKETRSSEVQEHTMNTLKHIHEPQTTFLSPLLYPIEEGAKSPQLILNPIISLSNTSELLCNLLLLQQQTMQLKDQLELMQESMAKSTNAHLKQFKLQSMHLEIAQHIKAKRNEEKLVAEFKKREWNAYKELPHYQAEAQNEMWYGKEYRLQ
eukprot:TRINITY_DN4751_c0_g1_i6.p1 TRINITY_DN4751_c0_g1~~TRINITY_DN4751_c0_g1_i6.p1  ORF type:complete len:174 (+),score=19.42 TRINITY_DN4751_c0_g1_i6:468-989(+)